MSTVTYGTTRIAILSYLASVTEPQTAAQIAAGSDTSAHNIHVNLRAYWRKKYVVEKRAAYTVARRASGRCRVDVSLWSITERGRLAAKLNFSRIPPAQIARWEEAGV